MRFSISSFITLAVAAAATVVAQPAKRARSINPPQSQNKHVDLTALPPVDVSPMTNAKRFARGLPPLTPVKRHPHRGGPHKDGAYPHGGTRVRSAPRAETSPSPGNNVKCNILVKTTEGVELGYIPASFNDYGQYGTPQGGQSGALEITFPVDTTNTESVSQINGVAVSAPDAINSFPYLSATLGFLTDGDDLGPGNPNYVAITGNSGPMDPGSPPSGSTENSYSARTGNSANSETAIWSYDPASQSIQAAWTNTDGKSVPTTFIYFEDDSVPNGQGNTLVATGDSSAFREPFGCTDTCRTVTFTCVPTA